MCTVSFIYKGDNDFLLTSNRDEGISRRTIEPKYYVDNGVESLYPKDEVAGGTWVGVSSKNRLLCLLNGAFEKHVRKPKYSKSRGLIVKELLEVDDLMKSIREYDFSGVEPFTLILIDWQKDLQLIELVWDEKFAHIKELPLESRIWSSSTLYTDAMKEIRRVWFADYLSENEATSESIFKFHETYGVGDNDIDLQIDRGMLKTVSITAFDKQSEVVNVRYKDLLNNKDYCSEFTIPLLAHE